MYGGQPLVSLDAMAVHTAAAFFILNVAILCVRPDYGLMELLTSDSPGGVVSRRLVPAALFVPTILGWLEIKAQRAGWYGAEADIALCPVQHIGLWRADLEECSVAERNRSPTEAGGETSARATGAAQPAAADYSRHQRSSGYAKHLSSRAAAAGRSTAHGLLLRVPL